jgi:hypothetical protein
MNIEALLSKYFPINSSEKVDLVLTEIIQGNPSLLHFNTRVKIICEIRAKKIQLIFNEKWEEALINDARKRNLEYNRKPFETQSIPLPESENILLKKQNEKKKKIKGQNKFKSQPKATPSTKKSTKSK